MKMIRSSLAAAVAAVGLAASMSAGASVIGGIQMGETSPFAHLETANLAQTFINGNGQNAVSYGRILEINGSDRADYCASGPCSLYYVANFNNSQNFSGSYVEFTSATISIYYANSFVNLLNQSSDANLALIAGMTPWLTLKGHAGLGGVASNNAVLNGAGVLTGASLSGSGFGLFDVDVNGPGMADVISWFDSNGELDANGGFADVTLNSSFNNSQLNDNDIANGTAAGCLAGTAAAGAWCYQGSANLRGEPQSSEVPEPATLALVGLAMLGAGAARRRQTRK